MQDPSGENQFEQQLRNCTRTQQLLSFLLIILSLHLHQFNQLRSITTSGVRDINQAILGTQIIKSLQAWIRSQISSIILAMSEQPHFLKQRIHFI